MENTDIVSVKGLVKIQEFSSSGLPRFIPGSTLILPFFPEKKTGLLSMSVAYIQVLFRLDFIMEENTMVINPEAIKKFHAQLN